MAADGTGTIYIPLEEFWTFVTKYAPDHSGEIVFGVPRVRERGGDLEIDYAFSTDNHPSTWAEKPQALLQWKELEKKGGS